MKQGGKGGEASAEVRAPTPDERRQATRVAPYQSALFGRLVFLRVLLSLGFISFRFLSAGFLRGGRRQGPAASGFLSSGYSPLHFFILSDERQFCLFSPSERRRCRVTVEKTGIDYGFSARRHVARGS